jgi:excisionase family DNA binding protein
MSQPTHPTLHLLSIPVSAKRIGKSERTIRRWIANGDLRAFKVGPRTVAIDRADLDAMIRLAPASYGPKARIVDLSKVVIPVEGIER